VRAPALRVAPAAARWTYGAILTRSTLQAPGTREPLTATCNAGVLRRHYPVDVADQGDRATPRRPHETPPYIGN
jgi:hypothetical protein